MAARPLGSSGRRTRDRKGSRIAARPTHAENHGPPPTSSAACGPAAGKLSAIEQRTAVAEVLSSPARAVREAIERGDWDRNCSNQRCQDRPERVVK